MKDLIKFRFAGIGIVVAMCAVFGAGVMLLWNALMPDIFGLDALNYWQAAGLLLLTRILFGGLGGTRHIGFGGDVRSFQHRNALREKWMKMDDGERAEFLRSGRERGFFHLHKFFSEQSYTNEKNTSDNEGGKHEQSGN